MVHAAFTVVRAVQQTVGVVKVKISMIGLGTASLDCVVIKRKLIFVVIAAIIHVRN